jgi:hypothetical protein
MEDFCQNKKAPPFIVRTAGRAVSKGGSLWLIFFRPFFVQRQRKGMPLSAPRCGAPFRLRRQ